MSKTKTPRNLLIQENSLKRSKTTKITQRTQKLPKYPQNGKNELSNFDPS